MITGHLLGNIHYSKYWVYGHEEETQDLSFQGIYKRGYRRRSRKQVRQLQILGWVRAKIRQVVWKADRRAALDRELREAPRQEFLSEPQMIGCCPNQKEEHTQRGNPARSAQSGMTHLRYSWTRKETVLETVARHWYERRWERWSGAKLSGSLWFPNKHFYISV